MGDLGQRDISAKILMDFAKIKISFCCVIKMSHPGNCDLNEIPGFHSLQEKIVRPHSCQNKLRI